MSKTDDIHRAVLARASQAPSPRPTPLSGARAYVAEAGQRLAEGLREENQRLKGERENGLLVLRLDPKRVRATQFINRNERAFLETDAKFLELKESLRKHGQEHPIRVRPLAGDPAADFEIVSGHRRHRAALALNEELTGGFTLLALLDANATESRDLVLKMYRENEERADLSPFEKGRQFQAWLDHGIFKRQAEIAETIGVHENTVLKYIQLAELPEAVLEAFGDPRSIALHWVQDLMRALKSHKNAVLITAEAIRSRESPTPPKLVFEELLGAAIEAAPEKPRPRLEVVKDHKGRVLFRIGRRQGSLKVTWSAGIDERQQKELAEQVQEMAYEYLKRKPPAEVPPSARRPKRAK